MDTNGRNPKKPIEYSCKTCDFYTSNKKDFNRHNITDKHKILQNPTLKTQKNPLSMCNCGKVYKHASSLCAHKNKCKFYTNQLNEINDDSKFDIKDTTVMLHILKQNDEFKQLIIEQNKTIIEQNNKLFEICKQGTSNTNISNVNSHNKTFNLNVFLNETCKDAMNITDFVDSLNLQLSDLENVGKVGYIEGISSIIIKNLQALEVHKRPVHCSDSKREVMYIKDEDKWEKENENKNKLRKVIKKVANKNSRLLPEFKAKHPDCGKSISKYSDQYNKLIVESMGGSGDNDLEKENKIIKKIAKEVVIDKEAE
jgi:hypothetical protein